MHTLAEHDLSRRGTAATGCSESSADSRKGLILVGRVVAAVQRTDHSSEVSTLVQHRWAARAPGFGRVAAEVPSLDGK